MRDVDVTVGIVTALTVESAAVRLVMEDQVRCPAILNDPNLYLRGTIPSTDPERPHKVVAALQVEDGTRNAAVVSAFLARSFPSLRVVVMCGIAGAVPAPHDPDRHVRLGDVVVATAGIVDYNHVRQVDGKTRLRRTVDGVSKRLLAADHELEVKEHLDQETAWYEAQPTRRVPARFARPADSTDVLTQAGQRTPHPDRRLSRHQPGRPRVHRGLIGSADLLLRDETMRDRLAAEHGIRAVEMEASGIAVGASLTDKPWFVVRGTVDYCAEATKNDVWHHYGAWVAAAYTRALLGNCHPLDDPLPASSSSSRPAKATSNPSLTSGGLKAIVDAMYDVRAIRDDVQRRAIIATLPKTIVVPDNVNGRLHLISLVNACDDHDGGRNALLDALEVALGSDSDDFLRVRDVFDHHW